ncbi:14187_t:CDS:1, partial [Gigaspora margarita]
MSLKVENSTNGLKWLESAILDRNINFIDYNEFSVITKISENGT